MFSFLNYRKKTSKIIFLLKKIINNNPSFKDAILNQSTFRFSVFFNFYNKLVETLLFDYIDLIYFQEEKRSLNLLDFSSNFIVRKPTSFKLVFDTCFPETFVIRRFLVNLWDSDLLVNENRSVLFEKQLLVEIKNFNKKFSITTNNMWEVGQLESDSLEFSQKITCLFQYYNESILFLTNVLNHRKKIIKKFLKLKTNGQNIKKEFFYILLFDKELNFLLENILRFKYLYISSSTIKNK